MKCYLHVNACLYHIFEAPIVHFEACVIATIVVQVYGDSIVYIDRLGIGVPRP
jgi:hypothetical protein